jgi:hypothetical protein
MYTIVSVTTVLFAVKLKDLKHLLLCLLTKTHLRRQAPLAVPKVEVIDLTEEAEYEYIYKRPH